MCTWRSLSESRMLEMGTSGLMSGDGKRATASRSRTAPALDSTGVVPHAARPSLIRPIPANVTVPRLTLTSSPQRVPPRNRTEQ